MSNGGEVTIRALAKETPETRANIIEYLRSECPLYEWVNAGGRDYLLVHAGLGGYSPEKSMDEYTPEELVWVRPTENTVYSDEFTTIVGHTPTCIFGKQFYGKIIKAQTFIDIDVGVAYGFSPVLLRLDDMKVFYGE
jgi:serine/threonine protein phosphatase 1